MSVIACPACKGKVSEQAEKCPHCGDPLFVTPVVDGFGQGLDVFKKKPEVEETPKSRWPDIPPLFLALFILAGVIYCIYHYWVKWSK